MFLNFVNHSVVLGIHNGIIIKTQGKSMVLLQQRMDVLEKDNILFKFYQDE